MKRGLLFFLLCLAVAGVCPAQGGGENLMLDHRLFSVRMGEYGAVHRYPSGFNMLNDVRDSLYVDGSVYGVCYSPLYDSGGISAALLRDDGPAMRDAQLEHPQCRFLCLMPSRFTAKTGIFFFVAGVMWLIGISGVIDFFCAGWLCVFFRIRWAGWIRSGCCRRAGRCNGGWSRLRAGRMTQTVGCLRIG